MANTSKVSNVDDASSALSSTPEYRMGRKELIALISAIMAFSAMAIDMMLAAFGEIRADFGLAPDSTETARIITVFFLGLAAGQLIFGPLADRYGRKRTLYMGAAVYILGVAISALAPTFDLMLSGRFVWGVGAAGARVVAVSIVRDRFVGAAMASAMSNVMAVFVLVPVFAPSIGAAIVAIAPWRAVFWFCAVFAMLVVVWSFRMIETLDPANRRDLDIGTIVRGYWQVSRTPVTFGYTMATVFIQASFTAYLASAELLSAEVWGIVDGFPLFFGGIAVMFGVVAIINGRVVERIGIDTVVTRAYMWIGTMLAGMLVVILVSGGQPNIWIFTPLLTLALSSFLFIMPNLSAAAMVPLGEIAGSGSALTGAVRVFLGSLIGGVVAERSSDSVTPLVLGITVFVALSAFSTWRVRQGIARAALV